MLEVKFLVVPLVFDVLRAGSLAGLPRETGLGYRERPDGGGANVVWAGGTSPYGGL